MNDAGHDFTREFRTLVNETAPADPADYRMTDMGNGCRFARRNLGAVLYVPPWGYRVYDDETGVWCADAGALMRLAKDTAKGIFHEAADSVNGQSENLGKHAIRSQSSRSLKAMLELAASELPLCAEPREFDADPMVFNAKNGIVDLSTGELHEHDPGKRMTKLAGAAYDPNAKCPVWLGHLSRIFANDAEMVDFVQRLLGYCLTGDTSEQIVAVWYGAGANGKSVTEEATRLAMGDYATGADFRSFMVTKSEGPRNDLARLAGARFVTASEGGVEEKLNEALIKQATGGEPLTVRFLHQEHFEYVPQFKLNLLTNHKPEIRGTDLGIWRRIRLVPFTVTIPDAEQDHDLPARLAEELSGILAWLVRGCIAWQERGLDAPEAVRVATAGYRAEMDIIGTFLAECTMPDEMASIPVTTAHHAYQLWAKRSNEKELSARRFNAALREHGVHLEGLESGTKRLLCWGIRLVTSQNEDDSEGYLP